jgi:uncharacterized protein YdhG (YjbR/CyaY superfamily)
MSPVPKTVDEYLDALSEEQRRALQKVRETIKAAAPEAAESISYGIPGYKFKGRPLIHFGAAKSHCAIYGAAIARADTDKLKGYDTSKGTIRFSSDKPLPAALVEKLVNARMAEIEAGASGHKSTASRKEE